MEFTAVPLIVKTQMPLRRNTGCTPLAIAFTRAQLNVYSPRTVRMASFKATLPTGWVLPPSV